jgi:hypothetical protein
MSITDILDAVAPGDYAQALAWMHVVAASEDASTLMLDDVPRLVTELSEEARMNNVLRNYN